MGGEGGVTQSPLGEIRRGRFKSAGRRQNRGRNWFSSALWKELGSAPVTLRFLQTQRPTTLESLKGVDVHEEQLGKIGESSFWNGSALVGNSPGRARGGRGGLKGGVPFPGLRLRPPGREGTGRFTSRSQRACGDIPRTLLGRKDGGRLGKSSKKELR